MKTVYLAGPITGKSYGEANDWREAAVKRLAKSRIKGLSPLRGKYYLEGMTDIPMSLNVPLSSPRGITTRDRWDCFRADIVLVNFIGAEKVSIGTVMEIAWADSQRVPTVVAMDAENVHQHPMILESIGFLLPSLDEALTIVEAILR